MTILLFLLGAVIGYIMLKIGDKHFPRTTWAVFVLLEMYCLVVNNNFGARCWFGFLFCFSLYRLQLVYRARHTNNINRKASK